jgi:hypothetical protein
MHGVGLREERRLMRIRQIALVVSLTAALVGCGQESPPAETTGEPFVMRCPEQPLPEFTLGPHSHPSSEQQEKLCSCIWSNLGKWERETSEKISQGKQSEVSALNMRAFPARFGKAIEECGGMEL